MFRGIDIKLVFNFNFCIVRWACVILTQLNLTLLINVMKGIGLLKIYFKKSKRCLKTSS